MKRITNSFAICLLGLIFVSSAFAQSSDQEAKEFVKKWSDAWIENKAATMCDFYHDSRNTVLVTSGGMQAIGFKSIDELYQQSFDEVVMEKVTFDDLVINGTDTSAFVTGKFVAETRPTEGDSRYLITCRTSLSLAKVGDVWKIIGEHSSALSDVERVQLIEQ